jgi:hypothetical protein
LNDTCLIFWTLDRQALERQPTLEGETQVFSVVQDFGSL